MIPPRPRDAVELGERAMACLAAPAAAGFAPDVLVAITVRRDHGRCLERCLASILHQSLFGARLGVVVLLDSIGPVEPLTGHAPMALRDRIWWVAANCGSAARARNAALDFAAASVPSARWVVRLDDDDRFRDADGIERCVALGDRSHADWVLAGNRVLDAEGTVLRDNPVRAELLEPSQLLALAQGMADGTAVNELPSCNLLLRVGSGFRYPEFESAEDHWLVAELLCHHADRGALATGVCLTDYTLGGTTTGVAQRLGRYLASRRALAGAIATWHAVQARPGRLLGWGNEGIVRLSEGRVHKHFYPDALDATRVEALRRAVREGRELLPAAEFARDAAAGLVASYPFEATLPLERASEVQVAEFLLASLRARVVCANVKRSNLRVRADGRLVYVDVGDAVLPMDVSWFLDAATRLYSIAVLGRGDAELQRRPTDERRPRAWEALPGFARFYREVLERFAEEQWQVGRGTLPVVPRVRRRDVTLMVKACAMDAAYLRQQAIHIIDQLVGPGDFAERLLLVDPFTGPFLRQHAPADLASVVAIGQELVAAGVFDRMLVAPADPATVADVHAQWFGVRCAEPRSLQGVPIAPQLWGFDQVGTRYLVQADIDVLVGRRDPAHDVVADMVAACAPADVLGVAFNIARPVEEGWRDYAAPAGQFVPEVRLGLMDLQRVRALRPLPNELRDGQLVLTWYRALERLQRAKGLRTLRGGDPRTFYVHPPNDRKAAVGALSRIRDLVAQGRVPQAQLGAWDLTSPDTAWSYAERSEPVVVFAAGRDTPPERIDRFAAGLLCQTDQAFGVVVIDDASSSTRPRVLADALHGLGARCTLVRTAERRGRMANLVWALRTLVTNPDSMVLIVDLDDALMDRCAVADVAAAAAVGHDLVLAAPFRPDAPLQLYPRSFDDLRASYGGNVWMHLCAFRRGLFDLVPEPLLRDDDGQWLSLCTDYATMVPMAACARSPVHLPRYAYWHERTSVYDDAMVRLRDATILRVLEGVRRGPDRVGSMGGLAGAH